MLTWHLLSKQEDYRFSAPTITQRKLRTLQRKAGDTGRRISLAGETKQNVLERRFLEEAERKYQNYVTFKARGGWHDLLGPGCPYRAGDDPGRA